MNAAVGHENMMKTLTYVALFSVAGLLVLSVAALWIAFVVMNFRERPQGVLNWSPFLMPDFVGVGRLWTTPAAMFSGALGVALMIMALGFHLQHLRRQELEARQIEQMREDKKEAQPGVAPYRR